MTQHPRVDSNHLTGTHITSPVQLNCKSSAATMSKSEMAARITLRVLTQFIFCAQNPSDLRRRQESRPGPARPMKLYISKLSNMRSRCGFTNACPNVFKSRNAKGHCCVSGPTGSGQFRNNNCRIEAISSVPPAWKAWAVTSVAAGGSRHHRRAIAIAVASAENVE